MKQLKLIVTGILLATLLSAGWAQGQSARNLHPMNRQLVQAGLMPVPKYYPEIPRITAEVAYGLYLSGKALFTLVSYSDQHLIVGGIHLTENRPPNMDPNRLPFREGQVLVVYCP